MVHQWILYKDAVRMISILLKNIANKLAVNSTVRKCTSSWTWDETCVVAMKFNVILLN